MTNKNFKWLTNDIDSTLVLKVVYKKGNIKETYGTFNVVDVLSVTGDKLEVETANIDDLTNLLNLGIVRFVNIGENSDILDIPFRNLYLLYKNANVLGSTLEEKFIPFSDLDVFSLIDGTVRNDFLVFSATIGDVTDDLREVMEIAHNFGSLGMQEKMEALNKITLINHRRLMSDDKNRVLK